MNTAPTIKNTLGNLLGIHRLWWQMLKAVVPNKEKGLINRLLEVWDHPSRYLAGWITLYLMFVFFFWVPSGELAASALLSGILVASMYLHELGHGIAMKLIGFDFKIIPVPPLGAGAAPKIQQDKEIGDKSPWFFMSWMLLAGPFVNLILLLLGVFLNWLFDGFLGQAGLQLAIINSQLFLFNMIPFSKLDAGQLVHSIMSSLTVREERFLTGVVLFITLIFMVLILGFQGTLFEVVTSWRDVARASLVNFLTLFVAILVATGIWHKQGLDDENHAASHQAMKNHQVAIVMSAYGIMLLIFVLYARFW